MRHAPCRVKTFQTIDKQKGKTAILCDALQRGKLLHQIPKPRNTQENQDGIGKRTDKTDDKDMLFFNALL